MERDFFIWASRFAHDESAPLFAAMDFPRDKALFVIMLYCGLRVSEAIALRPSDIKGSGLVLPAKATKGKLARSSADWLLDQALAYAGLEGRGISTHSFRRTALTNLSNVGVPLRVIQEISGHRSLASLQRYLEVSPEQKKRAIAALGY
ncbi:tyrosine-type recombinase/integrase [Phormidium tenue]|uniref:Tyr recombinase domain-containing protein n=1 Tax=Phormidium tenue NIES-30 TaxID=549789 RepID=A0A1U7IYD5_9CYAN|nr:site-specific integrase [Phormidium tenue]MBD2234936.1 site-specific integrase [Phormidium tenue FACHB-1052]OKH43474.1 hypothetical protein NIES30_25015 [Phormidium tenue NIES-30]